MSKKEKKSKRRGKRIPLKENPLYPPKQESSAIGVLAAIGVVVVIIVLDVILMQSLGGMAYQYM